MYNITYKYERQLIHMTDKITFSIRVNNKDVIPVSLLTYFCHLTLCYIFLYVHINIICSMTVCCLLFYTSSVFHYYTMFIYLQVTNRMIHLNALHLINMKYLVRKCFFDLK